MESGNDSVRPSGTVTFLFTDVEGSTRLWASDRIAMSASLALHDLVLRERVELNGGYVFSRAGDSFAAAFGRASDAVGAARSIQAQLGGLEWPGPSLRVRMGLHVGEAEERDGDYFGPVLNTAARVAAAGHGGQVLLTESVRVMAEIVDVTDLGAHSLRDVPGKPQLFQLGDSVFPPGSASPGTSTVNPASSGSGVTAWAVTTFERWTRCLDSAWRSGACR